MILIRKVSEPYGWMGNMSAYPVVYKDVSYKTTEALFQCLRFNDQEIIDLILAEKSPMSAKMVAKSHRDKMAIAPMSDPDVDNMRLCLVLTLRTVFNNLLLTSRQEWCDELRMLLQLQIESGFFWGAAFSNGFWIGKNTLGVLWMELRSQKSA